ncbi:MAG: hypothetical protein ACRC37_01310 [Lentisphaeria bacterium]
MRKFLKRVNILQKMGFSVIMLAMSLCATSSFAANNVPEFGVTTKFNYFVSYKHCLDMSLDPGTVELLGITGKSLNITADLESSIWYTRRLSIELIVSPLNKISSETNNYPTVSLNYGQQNGYLVNYNILWRKYYSYSYEATHPVGYYRSYGGSDRNYLLNKVHNILLAYRSTSCTLVMPRYISDFNFKNFKAYIYHNGMLLENHEVIFVVSN